MIPAFSASSAAHPSWDYIRPGFGRSGRSLSENNFAKERRDWLSILLREILQNALDARLSPAAPVTVSLRSQTLTGEGARLINELLPSSHLDRFKLSVPHLNNKVAEIESCLVVEDFGTSGLTGALDNPDLDGKGENWNAFWFREGEGGKETGSGNGGAGQGKITYFSTSQIRTLFAYTVRHNDGSSALFGASSFLRDYIYEGQKWKRDAYWGLWKGKDLARMALPVQDEAYISACRENLGIRRMAGQPGVTLMIPSPKSFDALSALRITIAEFFVPIRRGDLVVLLDGFKVDQASISSLATSHLSDEDARKLHTCTTAGYRGFVEQAIAKSAAGSLFHSKPIESASQLVASVFDEQQLLEMRNAIQAEESIAVRFPVTVKPRTGATLQCHFDVHLQCPFELDQPEQAVVRKDLLIGEEPFGGGKLRQRARGLTLVTDDALSRLLLTAEEATHLRWNTRLPRLDEYYKGGAAVVAIVRNAMVKLLEILTGGEQKKDYKLLARYFSAPGTDVPDTDKGKRSPKGKRIPPIKVIPPPGPRLLILEALNDGCRVRPAKAGVLEARELPFNVSIEFAYEGLDRDAFAEYDPLDFDLADASISVKAEGCEVTSRTLNLLEVSVTATDFLLTVNGFDRNLRLRMRLTYQGASNAAAINAQ